MKYIKQYEEYVGSDQNKKYPKKGDYVLLRFPRAFGYPQEFFDTHIGQIIKKGRGFSDYTVKFNDELDQGVLNLDGIINDIVGSYIRTWSDNKEDLEAIITSEKFNI